MDKNTLISEIAYIPKHFQDLQSMNLCEMLKKMGYFDFYNQVSEKDIEIFLRGKPECIQLWLQYSDDQRTDETWYFLKVAEGSYEVAYRDKTEKNFQHRFTNPEEACAFFIKKEVEDIRGICSSRK